MSALALCDGGCNWFLYKLDLVRIYRGDCAERGVYLGVFERLFIRERLKEPAIMIARSTQVVFWNRSCPPDPPKSICVPPPIVPRPRLPFPFWRRIRRMRTTERITNMLARIPNNIVRHLMRSIFYFIYLKIPFF